MEHLEKDNLEPVKKEEKLTKPEKGRLKNKEIENLGRQEKDEKEKDKRKTEELREKLDFSSSPSSPNPELAKPQTKAENRLSRTISAVFNFISGIYLKRAYSRFADILKEQNNPESNKYFRKQIEQYNQEQESESVERGVNAKIAFIGHIHSRGEYWKHGSDGDLSPQEIFEEYKKAKEMLTKEGYDKVFVVINDHQAIENSIELAEVLKQEGEIEPLVGIEVGLKEGYEILLYTTDINALREFYEQYLEKKTGTIYRYAKSKLSLAEFLRALEKIGKEKFILGFAHPAAAKSIVFGGTLIDRLKNPKEGPELEAAFRNDIAFYEAQNWYQNPYGSNCLAWSLREKLGKLGVRPFGLGDFHSKVQGTENLPFNGMFTEIRTDEEINSGGDFLRLFQKQKQNPGQELYLQFLRGEPATAEQYKEHIKNNRKPLIRNIIKGLLEKFGIKI